MSETGATVTERTLAFSAVAEAGTGLMLMIDPALVVALLLGADVSGVGLLLGRCFGISLLAIGMASLQYVLEEGNREGWFESGIIVALGATARGKSILGFPAHRAGHRRERRPRPGGAGQSGWCAIPKWRCGWR